MIKNPIYNFTDETSTGVDIVPINGIIFIEKITTDGDTHRFIVLRDNSNLDATSTVADLLALTAQWDYIATSTSTGGTGETHMINEMTYIYGSGVTVMNGDEEYLKSGNIKTDVASYPDAGVNSMAIVSDVLSSYSMTGNNTKAPKIVNSGTKMYVCGISPDDVHEYNLTTAGDLSSAVFVRKIDTAPADTPQYTGIDFNTDGTIMYLIDNNYDYISQYTLATPWDIATRTYVGKFTVNADATGQLIGLTISHDGKTAIFGDNAIGSTATNGIGVYEAKMSTPWDITTASIVNFVPTTGDDTNQTLFVNNEGTVIYSGKDQRLVESTMSTPWDISTLTLETNTHTFEDGVLGPVDAYGLAGGCVDKDDSEVLYFQYGFNTAGVVNKLHMTPGIGLKDAVVDVETNAPLYIRVK